MSLWKSFELGTFAAICLLAETAGSAHAECIFGALCAVEWSHGRATDLGNLPSSVASEAESINDAGQAVGVSVSSGDVMYATEWSHGRVINLGGLPGSTTSVLSASTMRGMRWDIARWAASVTPSSGATAKSSTWAACQAQRGAMPTASTPPGRWREYSECQRRLVRHRVERRQSH